MEGEGPGSEGGIQAVNEAVSHSSTCAGDADANRETETTCMEAENSSTPTSRIESESESPPVSQIERAGSDVDSDKEGQGPGAAAVAASGSTGAEKKDISGCKTDGLRRLV